jgi:hypothetical protein
VVSTERPAPSFLAGLSGRRFQSRLDGATNWGSAASEWASWPRPVCHAARSAYLRWPERQGQPHRPGRLHHKSWSEKDFFKIALVPAGGEAFVLDAHLEAGLSL